MTKPIVCLDFDGVLHSYVSGWHGIDVISDPPMRGAIQFLRDLINDGRFKVAIFSSRSADDLGIEAMKKWFVRNGFYDVDELDFPKTKPPAHITIDDRALRFQGQWPKIEELSSFKPYRQPAFEIPEGMTTLQRMLMIKELLRPSETNECYEILLPKGMFDSLVEEMQQNFNHAQWELKFDDDLNYVKAANLGGLIVHWG